LGSGPWSFYAIQRLKLLSRPKLEGAFEGKTFLETQRHRVHGEKGKRKRKRSERKARRGGSKQEGEEPGQQREVNKGDASNVACRAFPRRHFSA
jgi:hypothetical protein